MATNTEKFAAAYAEVLARCVEKRPDDFAYGKEDVPRVVAKMVPAFREGRASPGPAMRMAARACGVAPTLRAVREYLA